MFIDAIHGAALMGLHDSAYRPRPSMAGPERCLRQIVYKGRGVEGAPVGSRLAMVLKDGNAHERVSIDVLRHTLVHIHSEQHPIDLVNALPWRAHLPGYTCSVCTPTGDTPHIIPASTLHGHLDYLGRDLFGDNHLGEHKGVVSHIFKRFWEGEKEPLDYFTQNVCYFAVYGRKALWSTPVACSSKTKTPAPIWNLNSNTTTTRIVCSWGI